MPISPYYAEQDGTIYCGDARKCLRSIAAKSIHCCVTSPPYFGLRDYNVDGQIGVEKTVPEYVRHMVEVCSEVRRVLRDDGTLFLNIGDGYVGRKDGGINLASWAVAQALEQNGWILRQDIIWSKPDPIPDGSTFNRCTRAHEYIFLLVKQKNYYFDGVGIKNESGSNRHTVWHISKQGYRGFRAAFPQELVRLCIQAGTSDGGCCSNCGKPMQRTIRKVGGKKTARGEEYERDRSFKWSRHGIDGTMDSGIPIVETTGWMQTCGCPFDHEDPAASLAKCQVLDPFLGSGTTAVVARRLGRIFAGVELNRETLAEVTIPRLAKEKGQQGQRPALPRRGKSG